MNNNHVYDMLVVGGGPGGYTAALYAARAGLDTVVLEKLSAGGQMALTEQIDNYPGFEDGIDGFSLAEKMQKQAERFGVRSEYAEVLRMDLTAVPKLLETSEGIFRGKTVVLATGADPRTLGVAGEAELLGRGVAYCAACDGMFYKDKTVVVVGGGNSAAADALLLSRVAKKVILVHRRDTLRATKIYHELLEQAENVEFRWNSVVSALLSGDRLTGVRLRDAVTVKPLVTRYTTQKNTAAEYICGCALCSVAHCCVDWIWRDNISPDVTWVILSAITLAVCLADMSASPLRSYPA